MQKWTPGIFLLDRNANNSPIASVALFANELSNLLQHLRWIVDVDQHRTQAEEWPQHCKFTFNGFIGNISRKPVVSMMKEFLVLTISSSTSSTNEWFNQQIYGDFGVQVIGCYRISYRIWVVYKIRLPKMPVLQAKMVRKHGSWFFHKQTHSEAWIDTYLRVNCTSRETTRCIW